MPDPRFLWTYVHVPFRSQREAHHNGEHGPFWHRVVEWTNHFGSGGEHTRTLCKLVVESSVLVSSGAFAATMSARCVEKKVRFPIAEVWTRSPRTWIHSGSWLPSCFLCLCLSLSGREVTVGYARVWGSMGATFCHLAAPRSAIEFFFWDHWETAVLGQILAGRSRERISAIWRPLGRRLNFSSGIIGKRAFWAKSWPGAHGRSRRSWEVTGGYGHGGGKTEESGETAGKRC